MTSPLAARIGREALTALLYEAATDPKPGLVTPSSRGSHADMDYYLFLASGAALAPWFAEFARLGEEFDGADPAGLLPALREAGLGAERAMYAATGGVNTHKGLIFSLGLLCGAAGALAGRGEACDGVACARRAASIARGLASRELGGLEGRGGRELTVGERLYLDGGVEGIRGEAERGFPSVLGHSLPRLREELASGKELRLALVDALLSLFSVVEDTNVLGRAGVEGLALLKAEGAAALGRGGMSTVEGAAAVRRMDSLFRARRMSPGGCADLLAITYFLYRLG